MTTPSQPNKEEWEIEIEEYKCTGRYCNHETLEDHYIVDKDFITQALAEQREDIELFLSKMRPDNMQHYGYATDEQEQEIYDEGYQSARADFIIKLANMRPASITNPK